MFFFSFLFFIIYFFFSKTFEMLKSWNMLEHGQNRLPNFQSWISDSLHFPESLWLAETS